MIRRPRVCVVEGIERRVIVSTCFGKRLETLTPRADPVDVTAHGMPALEYIEAVATLERFADAFVGHIPPRAASCHSIDVEFRRCF